jgi:hypothetical protein
LIFRLVAKDERLQGGNDEINRKIDRAFWPFGQGAFCAAERVESRNGKAHSRLASTSWSARLSMVS